MPRYTDIDKLIAEYDRVHIGPAGGARKLMVEAPIADVAPRAEFDRVARELERVENLYFAKDTQLENAKAEVAREIFEEIESKLTLNKATHCGQKFYYIRLEDDIAELKKKYTEGGK